MVNLDDIKRKQERAVRLRKRLLEQGVPLNKIEEIIQAQVYFDPTRQLPSNIPSAKETDNGNG